jgi:putative membrane protein
MAPRGRRPPLHEVGSDPDPRFSLANERTFLAWNRTALAFIAAGLAVSQLLDEVDIPGGRQLLALPPIALGGVIALTSYNRWDATERAMRLRQSLPPSWLPRILGLATAAGAVVAAVVAVLFEG